MTLEEAITERIQLSRDCGQPISILITVIECDEKGYISIEHYSPNSFVTEQQQVFED